MANATSVEEAPVIALTNGLRVANFSSPHSFKFVDGSVLPACTRERAEYLKAVVEEKIISIDEIRGVKIEMISPQFKMTDTVLDELISLSSRDDIDIILLPLPIQEMARTYQIFPKCRTVRVADRTDKTIFTDKFCV